MDIRQEKIFWETIKVFHEEKLLPHIMIVGSWAEYIYSYYFTTNFTPNLKTRDLDFLYKNINRPSNKIDIMAKLKEQGFVYREDVLTGVGKFHKDNALEIEFLARSVGKGSATVKIPSIGIVAESLRAMNLLAEYPLELDCEGYILIVPEPSAYVLQKLYINPMREQDKQKKDIRAIRTLLEHIKESESDNAKLNIIFDKLHKNHQKQILEIAEKNFIEL